MKRIGIYGGTFNPCHNGHVRAARKFVKMLSLDTLYIMPTNIPPHKKVDYYVTAEQRLDMLQLVFGEDEKISVSDYEIRKQGISYTFETLKHFANEDTELFMLVGSDMFLSLDTWKNPDIIFSLCTVVCFSRYNEDREKLLKQKTVFEEKFGAKIEIPEYNAREVSSTDLRQKLNSFEVFDDVEDLIPDCVEEYIKENCLYIEHPTFGEDDIERAKRKIAKKLPKERYEHTLGVLETAEKICNLLDVQVDTMLRIYAGALLHDIAKMYPEKEQIRLAEELGVELSKDDICSPAVIHARCGQALAKKLYPEICDAVVCEAVRCHCTGKPDMNIAEKVVFLADYIEPGRKYDDCVYVRDYFFGVKGRENIYHALDTAVFLAYDLTIKHLKEKERFIHPDTVSGMEYLIKKGIKNV